MCVNFDKKSPDDAMAISNTETNILKSAETVFLRKGLEATTMQDIANEAGISRTLLHYYHRNKNALFQAILIETINEFIPMVGNILTQDGSLMDKAEQIINSYIEFLLKKPLIPYFLTLEVRRDPGALIRLIREKGEKMGTLDKVKYQIAKDLQITENTDTALAHLFTSVYGLIMFPFLVQPILTEVFLNNEPERFHEFMLQRKSLVLNMITVLWEDLTKNAPPPKEMIQSQFLI